MQTYPLLAAPISTKNCNLDDVRRAVKYDPTIWGDYFLTYTSDLTEISVAETEEFERQKNMVRKLLIQTPDDSFQKLELVDAIQRLGVGYHFEIEIDKFLRRIHETYSEYSNKDSDLHVVALRFRLLRQHGYCVQCDVFNKFEDEEGNFKESIVNDVKAMLSLYEAAHFGKHGEEILDRALEFSFSQLQSLVHKMTSPLSTQVNEALTIPIRKSLTRLGARKFISIYQEDGTHNEILLNFAKLDFNILQKIHQRELRDITKWWKALNFANNLPFARDRVVECYFWILGVYFEPQYHIARRILTKVAAMTSIIDDIYDVYGTLEDLQLFTDAIERWDITASEELPPYMRICYKALLEVYIEMENEMENEGKLYCVQYAKDEMKTLVKVYFREAMWFYSKYMPTMEEYMEVALVSAGYMMMSTTSMVGMGGVAKEDFDWVTSEPLIVRAASTICRLMDDIVGYGFEPKITAVHCYMNQNGVSEMEAFTELHKQVKNAWKDINKECLESRAVSMPILMWIVNLARVINLLYVDEDGYCNAKTKTKEFVTCLLVQPMTV